MKCCFIGHRFINDEKKLTADLIKSIENLITERNVTVFYFGSMSCSNDLCQDIVTRLKQEKYPFITRVYVRSAFEYISEEYERYLLKPYDETYYPALVKNSHRAAYIQRNREMINKSDICLFYYNEKEKSGTKLAVEYAKRKLKEASF